MEKKSKIVTYVAIIAILIVLLIITIFTKISDSVPGITAYSGSTETAQAVIGGYNWNSFFKNINADFVDILSIEYNTENILLVKPSEKITLRNSGKDFDSYKFYQDEIKYYNQNNEETIIANEVSKSLDDKMISFDAPSDEGTYVYNFVINYGRYGKVQYGLKVVVSHVPLYSVETLVKYKNTYIGDAPKVNQILNTLPYKEYKNGIVLKTATEPYELIVNYEDLEADSVTLFNNAVAIFALINNVNIVTFETNTKPHVYTRDELETVLGRNLTEYANDTELWKKEVIYNIKSELDSNNLKIYKTIFHDLVSKINTDYIVIDLDSFNKIKITSAEKRELLKSIMKEDKIVLEASNAEIRQRDTFKGILLYASEIVESGNMYNISVVKYDTEKKNEIIKYSVLKDGTIVNN